MNLSIFDEKLFFSELLKIKNLVLNALQLKEFKITKNIEVNILRIKDENKLTKSNSESKIVHSGDSDTNLILSNMNLMEFAKLISNKYDIIIEYNEPNNQQYDFYLKITNNKEELESELANYGLQFEKVINEVVCQEYK